MKTEERKTGEAWKQGYCSLSEEVMFSSIIIKAASIGRQVYRDDLIAIDFFTPVFVKAYVGLQDLTMQYITLKCHYQQHIG